MERRKNLHPISLNEPDRRKLSDRRKDRRRSPEKKITLEKTDTGVKILRISPALLAILNFSQKPENLDDILCPDQIDRVKEATFKRGQNTFCFVKFRGENGHEFLFDVNVVKRGKKRVQWFLENPTDGIDPLTKLYKQNAFMELAKDKLKSVSGHFEKAILFYIDLDGLKNLNTIYGHVGADRIVKIFSETLVDCFSAENCMLSRCYRGDEFIVLLFMKEVSELAATSIYYKLQESLRVRAEQCGYRENTITASCGWVIFDILSNIDLTELIKKADSEMGRRKEEKKVLREKKEEILRRRLLEKEVDEISLKIKDISKKLSKIYNQTSNFELRIAALEQSCITCGKRVKEALFELRVNQEQEHV